MSKTTLILEKLVTDPKTGDPIPHREEVELDTKSMRNLLSLAPKIRKYMKQGFQLVDVKGNGQVANYFRQQIQDFEKAQTEGTKYKVPIKGSVSLAWKESPQKEKVSLKRVKRFLRRKDKK